MSRQNQRKPTWTTREGDIINIEDMSDSHLTNLLNMLHRIANHGTNIYWGDPFEGSCGEDFVRGQEYLAEVVEYDDLTKEAEKRNLKVIDLENKLTNI